MDVEALHLVWQPAPGRNYLYFYGHTQTRFSAQIGQSSTTGGFMWMIFHEDFWGALYGEDALEVEEAKSAAQQWLNSNAKLDSVSQVQDTS